jgi:hypothetical protein
MEPARAEREPGSDERPVSSLPWLAFVTIRSLAPFWPTASISGLAGRRAVQGHGFRSGVSKFGSFSLPVATPSPTASGGREHPLFPTAVIQPCLRPDLGPVVPRWAFRPSGAWIRVSEPGRWAQSFYPFGDHLSPAEIRASKPTMRLRANCSRRQLWLRAETPVAMLTDCQPRAYGSVTNCEEAVRPPARDRAITLKTAVEPGEKQLNHGNARNDTEENRLRIARSPPIR